MRCLLNMSYKPGNVRELINSCCMLADKQTRPVDDAGRHAGNRRVSMAERRTLGRKPACSSIRVRLYGRVACNGDVSAVARTADISVSVYRRLLAEQT